MRVSLFITCLVDQCWPGAGKACVEVLRRAGCEVLFDGRQTCCGQPASNSGYREDARRLARNMIEIFEADEADAIVSPSGSCTATVHRFADLFEDEPDWKERALHLAARTHELSKFLVRVQGVEDLGARFEGRVTWHDACHGLRELGLTDEPRRLIHKVAGAELVEHDAADSCCGFGGTFAVKSPEISVAILDEKIASIERAKVDAVVSGDVSCLMQIGGRLSRLGSTVRSLHLAELLASKS